MRDHGCAFRTAVDHLGEARFGVRFADQASAHHRLAARAGQLAGTIFLLPARCPLIVGPMLEGHVWKLLGKALFAFDLRQKRQAAAPIA